MTVALGVAVQWAEWPPVGEVVLTVDGARVRLEPVQADRLGRALVSHAVIAEQMTAEASDPRVAEGIWVSRGGGLA